MSDPTPRRILDAALAAFEARGYGATTTAEICRRARVSNGSLFHHFGSKEGVAAALYLEGIRSYHDAMRQALLSSPDARAAVMSVVAAHQAWAEAEPALARFLLDQGRPGGVAVRATEIAAENARLTADLHRWAMGHVAAGRLRDLPPEVLGAQLIGPIQVFTRAWLSGRRPVPPGVPPGGDHHDSPVRALQHAAWRALRGPAAMEENQDD